MVGRSLSALVATVILVAASAMMTRGAPAQEPPVGAAQTFRDLRGREHVDAKLLRVDGDSIVIMSPSGIVKLPFAIVPPEVRSKFGVAESAAPQPESAKVEAPAPTPAQATTPAPMQETAATAVSTADQLQLTALRSDIDKYTKELEGLKSSRAQAQTDYQRAFDDAKVRVKEQYKLDVEEFAKKNSRRRGATETADGYVMRGRYVSSPQEGDPKKHPEVLKIKARLDGYDDQIRIREGWLKGLEAKARPIVERIEDAAKQARADADRQSRAAEEKKIQDRYMENRRLVAEREAKEEARRMEFEAAEKKEAEDRLNEKKARVDKFVADCAAIVASGKDGDVRAAYLKLQEMKADRVGLWDYVGREGATKMTSVAMDLFDLARLKNELAIATGCLGIAANLNGNSPILMDGLMRFFDEAAVLVKAGDFPALSHHLEFIKTEGVEDSNFVQGKKHELSSLALDRGWEAMKSIDFMTAGSAIETAKGLWPNNPRLGWLRTIVGAAFLVGILACLFGIFKGVEAIYWWSNRS